MIIPEPSSSHIVCAVVSQQTVVREGTMFDSEWGQSTMCAASARVEKLSSGRLWGEISCFVGFFQRTRWEKSGAAD